MKKVLAILGILLILAAGSIWFIYFRGGSKKPKGPRPVALTVSKHSDAFNESVQSMLNAYYALSEALVNWDEAAVTQHANELKTGLETLKLDELKVDTTGIYESALEPVANAQSAVSTIITGPSFDAKRIAFNNLSDNLRLLFVIVKYDREKMYWQECPMAFDDNGAGYWLSRTEEVRNPYLGTKHPKYRDGMLHCGGPKDTINFTQSPVVN